MNIDVNKILTALLAVSVLLFLSAGISDAKAKKGKSAPPSAAETQGEGDEGKNKGAAGPKCKCGEPIVEGYKFCPSCGAMTGPDYKCSSCGKMIFSSAKFCGFCGAEVDLQEKFEAETFYTPEEMYKKGASYKNTRNFRKAFKWFKKAGDSGNPDAQLALGICFMKGEGIKKNSEEGAKWLRKAAEQGNPKAQFLLAECCLKGDGVDKCPDEAVGWYLKSAEQGNKDAQFKLALCHINGEGTEANPEEAKKWLRKAAAQGDAYAKQLLDDMK